MTALPPNADELVSAYLDGEAAPDEVAVVEASDELMARVTELRSVSARLASPATPEPATRELHLAAALAAFDALVTTDGLDPVLAAGASAGAPLPARAATVRSLELARNQRTARRFPGRLLAAAAAAVLVVGITAVSLNRSDNSNDLADADVAVAAEAGAGAEVADAAEEEAAEEEAADAAEANVIDEEAAEVATELRSSAESETDAATAIEAAAPATDDALAQQESDQEAAEFAAGSAAAAPSLALPLEYFLGDFTSEAALRSDLLARPIDEFAQRNKQITEQGLFPDCQQVVPELVGDVATVVAEATVASIPVEVHLVPDQLPSTLLIIDKGTCVPLTAVPLGP